MKFVVTGIFLLGVIYGVQSVDPKRCIIYSSGGIDDGHALTLLLNADKQGLIKIHAIISSLGDTDIDNASRNLVRILDAAGRLDIPLYKGANEPILATFTSPTWYLSDGFGDVTYSATPNLGSIKPHPGSAVNDLLNQYPNQISILIISVATNAALPIKFFKNYANLIKDVYIMGGKYDFKKLKADYVRGEPEHNFQSDPQAVQILFGIVNLKITLLPEEVCDDTNTTFAWRNDTLGKSDNALCNLIKVAEDTVYKNKSYSRTTKWVPYDAFLVYLYLNEDDTAITSVQNRMDIDLCSATNKGQIIIRATNSGNIRVITAFNQERFKTAIVNACNNVCNGTTFTCNSKYTPSTSKVLDTSALDANIAAFLAMFG